MTVPDSDSDWQWQYLTMTVPDSGNVENTYPDMDCYCKLKPNIDVDSADSDLNTIFLLFPYLFLGKFLE